VEESGRDVRIDWHGHRDRGLSVPNAIAAYEAGADRIHGTALGIGERSGNTPMELLLVNLKLMGYLDTDLTRLGDYCRAASRHLDVPIPRNYPVVGPDAFETATGVHAAAVVKAMRKGDAWLVNSIYSGVPADMVGLEQRITVGPMSGKWNVIHWLESRGLEADDDSVAVLFDLAKRSDRVLTDEEILRALRA
jgi:2-isopropylmalate synthase